MMSKDDLGFMSLAEELETYVQNVVPQACQVKKYGGTLFTLKPEEKEGQFCGVFMYKQHVQLSFSQGANLADPKKLLSGSGKARRHINFKSMDDVSAKELKKLLLQASKL